MGWGGHQLALVDPMSYTTKATAPSVHSAPTPIIPSSTFKPQYAANYCHDALFKGAGAARRRPWYINLGTSLATG
jgi:hypothetical protein